MFAKKRIQENQKETLVNLVETFHVRTSKDLLAQNEDILPILSQYYAIIKRRHEIN